MLRKWVLFGWMLLISTLTIVAQDTIAIGETIDGELDSDNTVEYLLEAEAGDFLRIQLASEDFDTVLTIYDQDEAVIATNDDDGMGTNSSVQVNIPETGLYRVEVSAFSPDQSGDFSLSVDRFEVLVMFPNEPVEVQFGEEQSFWFSFKALANEAVTISAESNGALDTTLELIGPDGQVVASDDDSGAETDPLINKVFLPLDGVYLIRLDPFAGDMIEGVITVTVTAAEITSLAIGQTEEFGLGDVLNEEVYTFEAEEGERYRLTLSASSVADLRVEVYINNEFVSGTAIGNSARVSFDLIAPTDGIALVRVYGLFYYEQSDISLAITLSDAE